MSILTTKSFLAAILAARLQCTDPKEEQGGVILEKDGIYDFVKIKNVHEGTDTAWGLYETDGKELTEKVISHVGAGSKLAASFHTHPSFQPWPSNTDMTLLFQGFKHNVIYAPLHKTFSYSEWVDSEESVLTLLPVDQAERLVNK